MTRVRDLKFCRNHRKSRLQTVDPEIQAQSIHFMVQLPRTQRHGAHFFSGVLPMIYGTLLPEEISKLCSKTLNPKPQTLSRMKGRLHLFAPVRPWLRPSVSKMMSGSERIGPRAWFWVRV